MTEQRDVTAPEFSKPEKVYEASVDFHHGRYWPQVTIPGDSYGGFSLELRGGLGGAPASPSRSQRRALKRAVRVALKEALDLPNPALVRIEVSND